MPEKCKELPATHLETSLRFGLPEKAAATTLTGGGRSRDVVRCAPIAANGRPAPTGAPAQRLERPVPIGQYAGCTLAGGTRKYDAGRSTPLSPRHGCAILCSMRKILYPVLFVFPLAIVMGCTNPAPATPGLRLPTRAPSPTPSPTATPAPTPVYISPLTCYIDGLIRQSAGDFEGALQSFTWAIEQDPDFALAYVKRGGVYLALRKPGQALADVDTALALAPAEPSAWLLRGEALRMLKRPRRALEAFDRALALNPGLRKDTFQSRWKAALAASDVERMATLSREFVSTNPHDPMRYYYRGWGLIQSGESRTALGYLTRGISETLDAPALLWFTLGHAYAAEGAWREAVISFETTRLLVERGDTTLALHSDRPIVELFGALGEAYLGAGRCADAQAMLEYAILIGAPPREYEDPLEKARKCQIP